VTVAEVVGESLPGHIINARFQGVLTLSAQKGGGLSLLLELPSLPGSLGQG